MTELLASFAAAGGAPPASHEVVRVFRDGTVRALAGTAWPALGPASEAGVYEFALDAAALGEVERLATAPLEAPDAPQQPGSGRYAVEAGGTRLRWDPFATPPEALAALADRLRALLVEARGHPLAAVRLDVEAAGAFVFTALGGEPVGLTVSDLRARIVEARSPPSDPPPLAWVREAAPVEAELPAAAQLAPRETLTVRATFGAPPAGVRLRVDGFARVTADAAGERLEATLAAGPASGTSGS